jgi:PEP-CTERM motif
MKALFSTLLVLSTLALAPNAHAGPVSSCAPDFSSCSVFEDGLVLQLPGLAIAGDLILTDRWNGGKVSDVFRVFNNIFDTGGGTGLGITAFLYSEDLGNLPAPATYSVNAVTMNEAFGRGVGTIETDYNGNGTIYRIFSVDDGSPEPSTFALMGIGVAMVVWRRTRARRV